MDTSKEGERNIPIFVSSFEAPDRRYHPFSLLSAPGEVRSIRVDHIDHPVAVPDEVRDSVALLKGKEQPGSFFDGPFAGVTAMKKHPDGSVDVETGLTSNFNYIAASFVFRDGQSENPVRPFAAQAILFSPDKKTMLFEQRLHSLEYKKRRTTFGGALKPGEADPRDALVGRMTRKWTHASADGQEIYLPDLKKEQFTATGICRDNAVNVYCATYMATLTEDQYQRVKEFAKEDSSSRNEDGTRNRFYFELPTERIDEYLGSLRKWEPITYANILYALLASGLRTKEQVVALVEAAESKLQNNPLEYAYPMEEFLPK